MRAAAVGIGTPKDPASTLRGRPQQTRRGAIQPIGHAHDGQCDGGAGEPAFDIETDRGEAGVHHKERDQVRSRQP
jgi:hypothetical protein